MAEVRTMKKEAKHTLVRLLFTMLDQEELNDTLVGYFNQVVSCLINLNCSFVRRWLAYVRCTT